LEEDIVYLFGAPEPKLVAGHYMQAIKSMEEISAAGHENTLRQKMLPFLENAYGEVKRQTNLKFDVAKAASFEFDLIRAQSTKASFEDIYDIMVNLYREMFQSQDSAIQKAALLRTFLYQYKIRLLSLDQHIPDADIHLLKAIAKRSEEELNSLLK
jgi:hypothetical protein